MSVVITSIVLNVLLGLLQSQLVVVTALDDLKILLVIRVIQALDPDCTCALSEYKSSIYAYGALLRATSVGRRNRYPR